jgi:CheY-like chemotaxis protein/two-component sensor histidine kinase
LTRLNEELTRAKKQADEASASKTQFLAAASHDILQPLNAARLYATTLVERERGSEASTLAGNIDASLEAVEDILTTLLDISRLDSGALRPQWSTVRLDDVFTQLAREFKPSAREKGLELRFVPTSLSVRSDRGLLRRLLQNLVSNAIKYTPSGRVLVGVRRRGQTVRLEVWDTGLGIPASQHRSVFREFRRLAEGARTAHGHGLGLSIVERIAKALGIAISLDSEPGRGSVFRVALPITRPQAQRAVRAPHSSARPSRALTGLEVLAVDNEPAILDGMSALLGGWGCKVAAAGSLGAALALIERGLRPQVVVADFHLDDGDGLSGIARVRSELGQAIPALIITADASPALREAAAANGVALLNKPLKPAALRALLSRLHAGRIAAE